jgi:hypothetical protein
MCRLTTEVQGECTDQIDMTCRARTISECINFNSKICVSLQNGQCRDPLTFDCQDINPMEK